MKAGRKQTCGADDAGQVKNRSVEDRRNVILVEVEIRRKVVKLEA